MTGSGSSPGSVPSAVHTAEGGHCTQCAAGLDKNSSSGMPWPPTSSCRYGLSCRANTSITTAQKGPLAVGDLVGAVGFLEVSQYAELRGSGSSQIGNGCTTGAVDPGLGTGDLTHAAWA